MHALGDTLGSLTLAASNEEAFIAGQDRGPTAVNFQKLASLSKWVAEHGALSHDHDPTLTLVARLFNENAGKAAKEYARGNRTYALALLKNSANHCLSCHSRSPADAKVTPQALVFKPQWTTLADRLPPLEKGNFLAATKNFDDAMGQYLKAIGSGDTRKEDLRAWDMVSRNALAIAVRVKQDPEAAAAVATKITEATNAPFFVKENAEAWKVSIASWRAEPKPAAPLSKQALFAEGTRLMTAAKNAQAYPTDHGADVIFLRATAALHDFLRGQPDAEHASAAMLQLGNAYEILQGLNLGELNESFYKTCVYQSPHTRIARACYHSYEQAMLTGYTGSAGTFIPADELNRMKALEKLATSELIPSLQ